MAQVRRRRRESPGMKLAESRGVTTSMDGVRAFVDR